MSDRKHFLLIDIHHLAKPDAWLVAPALTTLFFDTTRRAISGAPHPPAIPLGVLNQQGQLHHPLVVTIFRSIDLWIGRISTEPASFWASIPLVEQFNSSGALDLLISLTETLLQTLRSCTLADDGTPLPAPGTTWFYDITASWLRERTLRSTHALETTRPSSNDFLTPPPTQPRRVTIREL